MLSVLVELNIMRNIVFFEDSLELACALNRKIFFRITAYNRTGSCKGLQGFGRSTIKNRGNFHALGSDRQLQCIPPTHAKTNRADSIRIDAGLLLQKGKRRLQIG